MAERRQIPPSARLMILFRETGVPALWIALWLPFLVHSFADSAYVLWFRDTVDLPARIVSAGFTSESRGRTVPRWEGYRVEAEFTYQGRSWRTTGDLTGLPSDGRVRVRVPRTRPDLAVAFDGGGPWYRQTPVWLLAAAAGLRRRRLEVREVRRPAAGRRDRQEARRRVARARRARLVPSAASWTASRRGAAARARAAAPRLPVSSTIRAVAQSAAKETCGRRAKIT